MKTNNQEVKPRNKKIMILTGAVVVLLCLLGASLYSQSQHSSLLEDLPNYTEVKGDFTVDGLEYEKQPHLGNPDAKVKVIEFADFKCPACKKWTATYTDRFIKDYVDTGKVELFFMNFAFLDRDSYLAASAGEAIFSQSNEKFWEYVSKLYENQGDESEIWATQKFILEFVKENINGIDYAQFEKDLKDQVFMYDVKKDYKIAGAYGVNGTPRFMVNGKLLPDSNYENLESAIAEALN